MTAILITGATGNVGTEVIQQLQMHDVRVVAAVRNVDKARAQLGDRIDYVPFDFESPETYETAFKDVEKMFLVRPPAISNVKQYIAPALRVAETSGVQQVVFLSLLGVQNNRIVPHYRIEQALEQSGMAWTFLRASFFMQNLSTTHRDEIKDQDAIFVPAGNGQTSFIDVRDIATVGAKALIEPGHENRAYDLTGSEALTYHEVAAIFSEVLGREIRYANPSVIAFAQRQRQRGIAWPYIVVMIGLYTTARLGMAKQVSSELAALLARPPLTVRQFVEDNRAVWL